jgi:hypothetical protein
MCGDGKEVYRDLGDERLQVYYAWARRKYDERRVEQRERDLRMRPVIIGEYERD